MFGPLEEFGQRDAAPLDEFLEVEFLKGEACVDLGQQRFGLEALGFERALEGHGLVKLRQCTSNMAPRASHRPLRGNAAMMVTPAE